MNRVHAARQTAETRMIAASEAILTNCDDLTPLEDHGNMTIIIMLRGVATLLSHDVRVDVAVKPCGQSRHACYSDTAFR